MTPAPSMAEVMRRLDEVVIRLDRLASTLEEGYLRKDVALEQSRVIEVEIRGLEDEQRQLAKRMDKSEESAATNRRLIVASFLLPLAVAVVVLLLTAAIHP